jgi:ABC-type sugar transport system ATPase subunit
MALQCFGSPSCCLFIHHRPLRSSNFSMLTKSTFQEWQKISSKLKTPIRWRLRGGHVVGNHSLFGIGQIWTAQNSFGSHSRCLGTPTIDQQKLNVQAGKQEANAVYKEVVMAFLQEKEKQIDQEENFYEVMDPSKDQKQDSSMPF